MIATGSILGAESACRSLGYRIVGINFEGEVSNTGGNTESFGLSDYYLITKNIVESMEDQAHYSG